MIERPGGDARQLETLTETWLVVATDPFPRTRKTIGKPVCYKEQSQWRER